MEPMVYQYRSRFFQWYHCFSAANGTIGANVTIGGNVGTNGIIGSPNGTIGKPNGVNSNIMINTSNLFLYFIFYVYFYYLLISS